MQGNIRWIAFGVVAVLVAGFFAVFAPQTMPGAATAERRVAEDALRAKVIDCTPNPYFEKARGFGSDWQFLRVSSDGARIEFNPFTIDCNPQNGHRDVWIQLNHQRADEKTVEDATTIQRIIFTRERYRYRIDCVNRQFALMEQQWMGDGPEEVAHAERMSGDDPTLRPIDPGGIGDALHGPACSTGRI
ncbi:MAG: hypothetical protein NW200_08625 [Hyphomonadaceae bacterium]|nr:hypothetical protein [Hyphomonadaceae bacterium]